VSDITLVLGGARSGKSRYAEALALEWSPRPVYVATSRVWDDDHAQRIEHHRKNRSPAFETIEEEQAISTLGLQDRVVVVDCMTLWLTNFVLKMTNFDETLATIRTESERFLTQQNRWILVSNEVGLSLHAETELGRKFVDLQGFLNQHLARLADRVVLLVAGLPLALKGEAPRTSS
jgi:adenosylcobinamide kinase / adenosylcobinamide-phosphate guanylyltransferase